MAHVRALFIKVVRVQLELDETAARYLHNLTQNHLGTAPERFDRRIIREEIHAALNEALEE